MRKQVSSFCVVAILFNVIFGSVMLQAATVSNQQAEFATNLTNWQTTGGDWAITHNGVEGVQNTGDGFYVAEEKVSDFSFETDLRMDAVAAGIVIRSKDNPSQGGYIISLDSSAQKVRVIEMPWPGYFAHEVSKAIERDRTYHLKIEVTGTNMKVYLNHEESPTVNYDNNKYSSGKIALFVHRGIAHFQNSLLNADQLDRSVQSISLDPSEIRMNVGSQRVLKTQILPAYALNKNYIVSIDNPSVINAVYEPNSGAITVTAISDGEAAISVTSEDGAHTVSSRIVVRKDNVNSVIVNGNFEKGNAGWTQTEGDAAVQPVSAGNNGKEGQYYANTGVGPIWYVTNGKMNFSGSSNQDNMGVYKGELASENITLEAEVKLSENSLFSLNFRANSGATQAYLVILTPAEDTLRFIQLPYKGELHTVRNVPIEENQAISLKINAYDVAEGVKIEVFLDGQLVLDYIEKNNILHGNHIGLFTHRGEGSIDHLRVYDYETKAEIFSDDFQTDTNDNYYFPSNTITTSDYPVGGLTSETFIIQSDYLSFIMGGGERQEDIYTPL